jgi:hypothetical protein
MTGVLRRNARICQLLAFGAAFSFAWLSFSVGFVSFLASHSTCPSAPFLFGSPEESMSGGGYDVSRREARR